MHTGRCIFVLLAHLYERWLTTLQRCKATKYIYVALLPVYTFFGMEVWNGIWKKILVSNGIWNGRFLVRNGRKLPVWNVEENYQYGIWKNRLPFHPLIMIRVCNDQMMVFIMLPLRHGAVLR